MATGHRWQTGGDEMLRYLATAYQERGQVHWPTLIAATAGIAGEMALLSREIDLPENGYVLGKNVSRFLYDEAHSPKSIWGYCLLIAREAYDLEGSALPEFHETESRITVSLAANPEFVPLSVPAHIAPRHNILNAGPRHRRALFAIATTNGLDNADSAFALATATMKILGFTRHLGAANMMTLAMEAMIGCAHVAPLPEPLANPSYGPITDILPQGRIATPIDSQSNSQTEDLWGGKPPELEPMPDFKAIDRAHEARTTGFGRRR